MTEGGWNAIPLSTLRSMEFDLLENARTAHHISSFGELDFTGYRAAIKAYRKRKECGLSILAFIMKGLADELHEHPSIQSYRSGKHQVVEFSDVDLSFMIEKL